MGSYTPPRSPHPEQQPTQRNGESQSGGRSLEVDCLFDLGWLGGGVWGRRVGKFPEVASFHFYELIKLKCRLYLFPKRDGWKLIGGISWSVAVQDSVWMEFQGK